MVFYLHDGFGGFVVGLLHIAVAVSRGEAGVFAFVEGLYKAGDDVGVYVASCELVGNVVSHESLYGHGELVAYVAPKGAEHLVVELALLLGGEQLGGLL